jgi:hypothetical protein
LHQSSLPSSDTACRSSPSKVYNRSNRSNILITNSIIEELRYLLAGHDLLVVFLLHRILQLFRKVAQIPARARRLLPIVFPILEVLPEKVYFSQRNLLRSHSSLRTLHLRTCVRNQLKVLVKVGSVDFQQDDSQGNPVLAYLQRRGTAQGLTTPLANGYSLNIPDVSTTFDAPLTNKPYSKISGDFNPIHVNPYFSDFASLPATITHGMWSSAATRCYVESVVARGHPDRMIA